MEQADITVVQNDFGYYLNFVLQDFNGSPVDLTNAVLTFRAQVQNQVDIKFSGAMSVVSAPAGTCKYLVAASNFNTVGLYNAQVRMALAGQMITFGDILVTVTPEIPE